MIRAFLARRRQLRAARELARLVERAKADPKTWDYRRRREAALRREPKKVLPV